jgi:hypothetical protein
LDELVRGRKVWHANLAENFNVSIPYLQMQVRFCRYRFSPNGELGYSGIRGAVGLGYRSTVQALFVNSDILLLMIGILF